MCDVRNRFCALLCGCACLLLACSPDDLTQQLAGCAGNVTQIEFSQGHDTTLLTKIGEQWVVNHGRPARAERVFDWWRVTLNWQLRPLAADETVTQKIIAQVAREGIHTKLYGKRLTRPLCSFHIGNLKHTGTVVCVDGQLFLADESYSGYKVMEVYSAKSGFWKDATVCSYLPLDLDTVCVEHLQRPAASFRLIRDGHEWQPVSLDGTRAAYHKNEALINRYVTCFRQVAADAMTDTAPPDTCRHLQHRISIKSAKGNLTVELFGIPLAKGEGYDTDKCLLFIDETKEWAHASWVSFDLLLRDLDDFVDKK